MLTFRYSSLIDAPVETVWAFHERPDILTLLTPPWQPVQIIRREGGLGAGAIIEFRLWLGLLPVPWIARHTDEYEPLRQFTDIQEIGPLESWTHRHRFASEGNQTRLTDEIEFTLPASNFTEPLLGEFIQQRLQDMFRYRHEVTARECQL
jgi:ligand-binding SRPBCC domain-containing protein